MSNVIDAFENLPLLSLLDIGKLIRIIVLYTQYTQCEHRRRKTIIKYNTKSEFNWKGDFGHWTGDRNDFLALCTHKWIRMMPQWAGYFVWFISIDSGLHLPNTHALATTPSHFWFGKNSSLLFNYLWKTFIFSYM